MKKYSFWQRLWREYQKEDLVIGMTEEELIAIWGQPSKKNIKSYGDDQWVYYTGFLRGWFCYFNNGQLRSWSYSD